MSRKVQRPFRILMHACLLLAVAACGDPRIPPANLDPGQAASSAMELFDSNKDGFLDAAELERCPGLKSCLKEVDNDADSRLTADEISERLTKLRQTGIGLLGVSCEVHRNGVALAGAIVTLVPEKFLQPALKSAMGTSDQRGQAVFQVEGQPVPGAAPGFYRVEVSLKNTEGQETIPPHYNVQSTLGFEVAPFSRGKLGISIDLKF